MVRYWSMLCFVHACTIHIVHVLVSFNHFSMWYKLHRKSGYIVLRGYWMSTFHSISKMFLINCPSNWEKIAAKTACYEVAKGVLHSHQRIENLTCGLWESITIVFSLYIRAPPYAWPIEKMVDPIISCILGKLIDSDVIWQF